jgi:hypothetical protein
VTDETRKALYELAAHFDRQAEHAKAGIEHAKARGNADAAERFKSEMDTWRAAAAQAGDKARKG